MFHFPDKKQLFMCLSIYMFSLRKYIFQFSSILMELFYFLVEFYSFLFVWGHHRCTQDLLLDLCSGITPGMCGSQGNVVGAEGCWGCILHNVFRMFSGPKYYIFNISLMLTPDVWCVNIFSHSKGCLFDYDSFFNSVKVF